MQKLDECKTVKVVHICFNCSSATLDYALTNFTTAFSRVNVVPSASSNSLSSLFLRCIPVFVNPIDYLSFVQFSNT